MSEELTGEGVSDATQGSLEPEIQTRLHNTLKKWRESLMTMDRRQRLLYFKHLKTGTLEFDHASPLDTLAILETTTVPVRPVPGEYESRSARALYVKDKHDDQLRPAMRRIEQVGAQAFADRGVWTLYLGLLMLRWIDADNDNAQVDSPVLLVPVRAVRTGADTPYVLERTDDDITVNPVLKLKLAEFGIELPDVDPDDVAFQAFLHDLGDVVGGRPGWRVDQRMVLGNFTFQKEAMYRDLLANASEIEKHAMVQLLALGPDAPSRGDFGFPELPLNKLDDLRPPESMFSILDADSSQRRCIISAADGGSFVMDGPPGTGKSQTIANMIAELIASGKTVLFVSEKAAALDVVKNRLARANLSHFLFELHSHFATRKEVAAELSRTLQNRAKASSSFSGQDVRTLTRDRNKLTEFAQAMNTIDIDLGWSLFTVLGRLAELDVGIDASLPPHSQWEVLSQRALADLRDHAANLGRAWDAVHRGEEYVWRDLKNDDVGAAEVREYRRLAKKAIESLDSFAERLELVDDELGIKLNSQPDSVTGRIDLLRELGTRRPGMPTWYDHARLPDLEARLNDATSSLRAIDVGTRSLIDDGYHRWRELDPALAGPLGIAVDNSSISNESTASQLGQVAAVLAEVHALGAACVADTQLLSELLGLPNGPVSLERCEDIARLAQLAASRDRPEAFWLNSVQLQQVEYAARVMDAVVDHVNRLHESLREVFKPDVLNLDLNSLAVRFRDTHTGLRKWGSAARQDRKLLKQFSVSGKADKAVLSHLDEAASWQRAAGEMHQAEGTYARELGSRYRGVETEFENIRSAVANAREALRIAGVDANSQALASQISLQAVPDPRLLPVATRLMAASGNIAALIREVPVEVRAHVADDTSLETLIDWARAVAAETTEVSRNVDQASSVAQAELTVQQAYSFASRVRDVLGLEAAHLRFSDSDRNTFGDELSDGTDFDGLMRAVRHSAEIQRIFPGPIDAAEARRLSNCSLSEADLSTPYYSWVAHRDTLFALFVDVRGAELRTECEAGISEARELLAEMEESAPREVELWCLAQQELRWGETIGLEPVIEELRRAPRTSADVEAAVEYVALEAWADAKTRRDSRLADYRADARDALVAQYKELDQALIRNAHARVIERCSQRAPTNLTSRSASIVKREGEKKTRHKPVRVLLDEASGLVQQLKPCFMMSPLSVSQYLPNSLRFDVVIFDEASQVLPADAVNSVYRGRQLIVAGDQKQLPPTSFFAAAVDESEDDDDDSADFQSVLDLAKGAGGLQSLPLNWHYRSRHEDLITFSNSSFYDGRLMTFPGAVFEAPDLGVSLLQVDGVYRRGTSRDNPVEASKIVERLIWFRSNRPNDSIGVVTFSAAQADRVLQELEAQTPKHAILEGLLSDHDRLDGFFVKSLENVQGDERDVILFSIGYGPDEIGKFTANFGPLNRDGGWRRLNVAVTRARKRVEVVASFGAGDMPSSTNRSILHLQKYLDFAQRGAAALALDLRDSEGDVESVFEEQVIARIRSWGYTVRPQVGVAGYRIDMAVVHPERQGEYVLGIECDGAAYHSGQTARDRDRLRQQVLEGLGWRLHRIWGLSWWRDKASQEERLRSAIEEAIRLSGRPVRFEAPADHRVDEVEFEEVLERADVSWTVSYVEYEQLPVRSRDPRSPEGIRDMALFFRQVISVEAPIHREVLHDRFRNAWGVGRIGTQIRRSVDTALDRAHETGPDADGFFRLRDAAHTTVRVPTEAAGERKVGTVPPEEIETAMINLVKDAVALDESTLVKQTALLFGWQRLGSEIRSALGDVVTRLIVRKSLFRTDSGDLRCPSA